MKLGAIRRTCKDVEFGEQAIKGSADVLLSSLVSRVGTTDSRGEGGYAVEHQYIRVRLGGHDREGRTDGRDDSEGLVPQYRGQEGV